MNVVSIQIPAKAGAGFALRGFGVLNGLTHDVDISGYCRGNPSVVALYIYIVCDCVSQESLSSDYRSHCHLD
jgi:hypothetical protein